MKMLSWSKVLITTTSQILITPDLRSVLIELKARASYLIPLFLVVLFFVPINVNSQETDEIIKSLTSNKTIVDGQEVTVVYVTIDEPSDKDDGQVMISSSALIGFIGLGSFISASSIGRTTKFEIKLYAVSLLLVTAFIILHLIIIALAFLGDLSDEFYSVAIITTMFLIGAIITSFIFMTNSYLTHQHDLHRVSLTTDDAVNDALKTLKKESKSATSSLNNESTQ